MSAPITAASCGVHWPGMVRLEFEGAGSCLRIHGYLTPDDCDQLAASLVAEANKAREAKAAEEIERMREEVPA